MTVSLYSLNEKHKDKQTEKNYLVGPISQNWKKKINTHSLFLFNNNFHLLCHNGFHSCLQRRKSAWKPPTELGQKHIYNEII